MRPRLPPARALLPLLLLASLLPAPALAGEEPVVREIARIADAIDGTVGVAAMHLPSGAVVAWNGGERFPMASAYKIPIAVRLLTMAGRGEIDLDSMIAIRPVDLRPGSGILGEYFEAPGLALSLGNLLRLSILVSDNTATDRLLEAAGGPAAVTRTIRRLGITGMRVDRTTLQLLLAVDGAEEKVGGETYSREAYDRAVGALPESRRAEAAWRAFLDVRDSTTPLAMARLLASIWTGKAVPPAERDLLIDLMTGAVNPRRLKGMLPPGLEPPPHKTGTIWGGGIRTVNDAGIVELPAGAGAVAIALFVTRSREEVADLETVLAQITRTVVDHFLLTR